MKAEDIRDFNTREITQRIKEEQEQLSQLRFQHAVAGQLENPLVLRQKRRLIARLKTILREKHDAEATADA